MGEIDARVHIDHVVLRVTDVQRSVRFYGDILGLAAVRADAEGAALGPPGDDHPIIVLTPSRLAGPTPTRATGLFHTAIRWPTRVGLGEVAARLALARYPLTGVADHGVSEALYLDDPDGNGVELYWDRPMASWPEPAPGERIGMFTEPLDVEALLAAADGTDTTGCDIGHVHLQVANLDAALAFWTQQLGFGLMMRYGPDAAFVAAGDYHHHIGLNTWRSKGAPAGAPELPGLDAVAIGYPDQDTLRDGVTRLDGAVRVPDGVRVVPVLA